MVVLHSVVGGRCLDQDLEVETLDLVTSDDYNKVIILSLLAMPA